MSTISRSLSVVLLIGLFALCLGAGAALGQADGVWQMAEYDLGPATITDPSLGDLAIDTPLQGLVSLPAGQGPHPLVVILHGRHAMCGTNLEEYPCAPGEERRYDLGFGYLAQALAERGYASLAINLNAAMTEAFGRADIDARVEQVLDLHLAALREAVAGGDNPFGVPLADALDFERMALIGHSSGGGAALSITRAYAADPDRPDARALLLLAAAYNVLGPEGLLRTGDELYAYYSTPSDVPLATVLPDCDGDQIRFWTHTAYEAARLDEGRSAAALSVRLFRANHNQFNTTVDRQDRRFGYDPCFAESSDIMSGEAQRDWVSAFAPDFFDAAFGAGTSEAFDVSAALPAALYGERVELARLAPAEQRRMVLGRLANDDSPVNATGGTFGFSSEQGVMTCRAGDLCVGGVIAPGRFPFVQASWAGSGLLMFGLGDGAQDATAYDALHLRAAVNFLWQVDADTTALSFSVLLTDADGMTAGVEVRDLSALSIPPRSEFYGYDQYVMFPASVLLPLDAFEGIDLTRLDNVAIQVGDEARHGALLLADLEFIRFGE
jgi:dienelactone hydrolase